MKHIFFRIAFLVIPPVVLSFCLVKPVEIPLSLDKAITTSTTFPSSTIASITGEELRKIVNNINEVGINIALIKYDTSIESRFGGFLGQQQIISGYLFCDNNGQKQTLLYGDKKTISENSNIGDTKSALEKFFCDKATNIGPEVIKIEPGKTFSMETYSIIRLNPTYSSYIMAALALLAVWIGLLALIKEGLRFVKIGFKIYFWGNRQ